MSNEFKSGGEVGAQGSAVGFLLGAFVVSVLWIASERFGLDVSAGIPDRGLVSALGDFVGALAVTLLDLVTLGALASVIATMVILILFALRPRRSGE